MRFPVPSTARTRRVLLGGGGLLASRVFSAAAGLLLTGLVSRYLTPTEFGLWSILSGLPMLVMTMDFGLGNTLRNKMAVLSADNAQNALARRTFFACFSGFLSFALLLTLGISLFYHQLPWHVLFSFDAKTLNSDWNAACAISVGALILFLPLSLGNFGLLAYQETHWSAALDAVKALLTCAFVLVALHLRLSFLALITIFYAGLLLSAVTSLVYFLVRRSWTFLWPPMRETLQTLRVLAPESSRFAVLQMSAGVILLTDTILVSWACGLSSAGDYALVQKLYFYLVATESLLLTPLWSAYTEAHAQKEHQWIIVQLKRSLGLTILLIGAGTLACGFLGPWLIHLWTRKWIHAPSLFLAMTAWVWAYGISHCLSVYLNAVGRLHRQSLLAALAAIANIPLALWLGKLWGPAGVCWAGFFCIVPSLINNPIEVVQSLRTPRALI